MRGFGRISEMKQASHGAFASTQAGDISMQVNRYSPFDLMGQIQNDLSRVLESRLGPARDNDNSRVVTAHWAPSVDIKEEPERFLLLVDLPGVKLEDIEITMEEGVLSIKGERNFESSEAQGEFQRIERARGVFYRRFSLPDTANSDAIEASGHNGVLQIVIPKQQKTQPRRIAINAAG